MRKNSKGVSWLEVIIVIVAVVLITKIILPSVFSKPSSLHETSALRSVRTIVAAETNYAQAYDTGYSTSLSVLGPPPDASPSSQMAGYLDTDLASGAKEEYVFSYKPGAPDENGRIGQYTLNANPVKPGKSGNVFYFVDQSGQIHVNPKGPATANDTPYSTY